MTRRTARRVAWAALLIPLALAIAASDTTPPDRPAAAYQAATWCAAHLHARGITPAPGGCEPRP